MPDLAPFTCSFTRDLPDLLVHLDCSVALSTYQAGKVIFLSPSGENVVQLTRNFRSPMGMAVDGDRMAVATKHEVVLLRNAPHMAATYPRRPGVYDALFVPRAVYFTGTVDLHDMAFSEAGLLAVNTMFSCLCRIDAEHSFTPIWQPPFISELAPEDRCHLNGMAMQDGRPRYVTALGATDAPRGWSEGRRTGGVLLDVETGEVVIGGLAMPHSPRIYDGQLYVLESATGLLLRIDPEAGTRDEVCRIPGFARGMTRRGDYLFVGHSRLRKRHQFGDLPIAQREPQAGFAVVHLPTGAVAGGLKYHMSCEEIYDVHVLPGMRRPNILGVEDDTHRQALVPPHAGYWGEASEDAALQATPM